MIRRLFSFLRRNDGSIRQRTVRASIWVALASTVIFTLSFVRSIILARLLSPEDFGLIGICLMVFGVIEIFTAPGFVNALIYRKDDFNQAANTAFVLFVVRGFLLTILVIAIAPAVGWFYEQERLTALIAFLSISFFIGGFSNIYIVAYQKEINFKRIAIIDQIKVLLTFIITIALAYKFRDVWALVIGHVAGIVIGVLLTYLLIPYRPKFIFNKKIAKDLFRYGKFVAGLNVFVFLTTEIDNAVLGKVLGMDELGFYVIAYMLANLPATHFSKILSKTLFPAYSKLQDDLNALKQAYTSVFRAVSLFTIPAAFGLAVLADELIVVMYGEKWASAAMPLQILAVFGCLRALSSISGYLYHGIGKPNIPFYLVSGKFFIIAIIIYPLIMRYGIEGAAIAVTAPSLVEFFIGLVLLRKIMKINIFGIMKDMTKAIIASAAMTLILIYLRSFLGSIGVVELVLLILAGVFFYGLMCSKDIIWFYRQITGRKVRNI